MRAVTRMMIALLCIGCAGTALAETRILFAGRTNGAEDYELYSIKTNGDLTQITQTLVTTLVTGK